MAAEHAIADRRWPDATVVILASGPSLVREDVDLCRGLPTIAVNDTYQLAPWANVLYASDQHWWVHHRGVPGFAGERWSIGQPKKFAHLGDMRILRNGGREGLSLNPREICTGSNSTYAAVNLAVHFGASRIVLLGLDLAWDGQRSHFFGRHPRRLDDTDTRFPYFRNVFKKLARLAQGKVEIINCSRRTTLTCFPRRPLADVLAEIRTVAA